MSNIGGVNKRLRELRQENQISQQDLADMVYVPRTYVTEWENGLRVPETELMLKLAKIFKTPIDYICGRTEDKYAIKELEDIKFDLTKLNGEGIKMLLDYYNYLVSSNDFKA